MFVDDLARAQQVLWELTDLGVHIALDDFGTGYSSLSYLKRLPVDTLKIDRMFIRDIDIDSVSQAIVSAVVELAHTLHMTVVAEGIETAAQHQHLAAFGCDAYQGFYFARPTSATAIAELWASGSPRAVEPEWSATNAP